MMKFAKQIKSIDRKLFPLRRKYSFINKLYNHILNINVKNSLHSKSKTANLLEKANFSLNSLLEPTENDVNNNTKSIPKIIWMFWDSGFESAPDVVKLSVESWTKMNPGYQVNLLDNNNLKDFLGFDFYDTFYLSTVHCFPATKADLLRLHLLSKHGGVWADATTFCLEPLDNWLGNECQYCNFFLFKHEENNSRPMEAWFLSSPKGSEITKGTLQLLCAHIFKERELSLFITGKPSIVNKVMLNPTIPQDIDTTYRAEEFGFMPYFTVGYAIYNTAKIYLSKEQLQILLREDKEKKMHNNHALTNSPVDRLNKSFVSKQTYSNSYLKSNLYKDRVKKLLSKIEDNNVN